MDELAWYALFGSLVAGTVLFHVLDVPAWQVGALLVAGWLLWRRLRRAKGVR